jgi:hypothetical protein
MTDEGAGQDLKSELLRQQSNIGLESIAKVQLIIDDFGEQSPHYKVTRTLFKYGYETIAKAR